MWGQMHSLPSVHAALAGHPLRMLSIRKECVPPPRPPSTPMPPVPPPTSPTLPTLSTQELVHSSSPFSSPFQQHQPFRLSSPVSTILSSSTPQHKHQTSPSPPSEDSDATQLPSEDSDATRLCSEDSDATRLPSPQHIDSDATTLDFSPTPSQQSQRSYYVSPELFGSPSYTNNDTTVDNDKTSHLLPLLHCAVVVCLCHRVVTQLQSFPPIHHTEILNGFSQNHHLYRRFISFAAGYVWNWTTSTWSGNHVSFISVALY